MARGELGDGGKSKGGQTSGPGSDEPAASSASSSQSPTDPEKQKKLKDARARAGAALRHLKVMVDPAVRKAMRECSMGALHCRGADGVVLPGSVIGITGVTGLQGHQLAVGVIDSSKGSAGGSGASRGGCDEREQVLLLGQMGKTSVDSGIGAAEGVTSESRMTVLRCFRYRTAADAAVWKQAGMKLESVTSTDEPAEAQHGSLRGARPSQGTFMKDEPWPLPGHRIVALASDPDSATVIAVTGRVMSDVSPEYWCRGVAAAGHGDIHCSRDRITRHTGWKATVQIPIGRLAGAPDCRCGGHRLPANSVCCSRRRALVAIRLH